MSFSPEIRAVPILTEPTYQAEAQKLPGVEGVAGFENLRQHGVIAGYSWKFDDVGTLLNMSSVYDKSGQAQENLRKFLEKLQLPTRIVRFAAKSETSIDGHHGILEVTQDVLDQHPEQEIQTTANFIYTKLSGVTLLVRPADCPTMMVTAINEDGERIVGVGHWGREGVDEMNPMAAITHLITPKKDGGEGCDPNTLYMGIAPGIGEDNHTLKTHEIAPGSLGGDIVRLRKRDRIERRHKAKSLLRHWERWLDKGRLTFWEKDGLWHIDLLGRILDQISPKIPRDHIIVNTQDTYTLAEQRNAFSHRWSLLHKNTPEAEAFPEGRMAVAIAKAV